MISLNLGKCACTNRRNSGSYLRARLIWGEKIPSRDVGMRSKAIPGCACIYRPSVVTVGKLFKKINFLNKKRRDFISIFSNKKKINTNVSIIFLIKYIFHDITGSHCKLGHLNKTDYRLIRYLNGILIRQKCWNRRTGAYKLL